MTEKSCLGNFPLADEPSYEGLLQCMRCGFCLPTCPTYVLTGRERSSPRGRVALAKAVADNQIDFTGAFKEEADAPSLSRRMRMAAKNSVDPRIDGRRCGVCH